MANNPDGTYRGEVEPLPMPDDSRFDLPQPKATPTVNTPPIGTLVNPPSRLRPNTPIRPLNPMVQINRPDPRIFPVADFNSNPSSGIQLGYSPFVNLNPNYWNNRSPFSGSVVSAYNGPALPPDVAKLPEATFAGGTDSSSPSVQTNSTSNAGPNYASGFGPQGFGGTGYPTYGEFSARRMADLATMSQQADGGRPNNVRGTSDAGHTVFTVGQNARRIDSDGNFTQTPNVVQNLTPAGRQLLVPKPWAGYRNPSNTTLGPSAIFQNPSIATTNILRGRQI